MKRYIRYILASITLAASGTVAAGLALCPHAFKLNIFVPEHNTEIEKLVNVINKSEFEKNPKSDEVLARLHTLSGESLSPIVRGLVQSWQQNENTFLERITVLELKNKIIGPIPYWGRFAEIKSEKDEFLSAYMGLNQNNPEFKSEPPSYKKWVALRSTQDEASRRRFVEQFGEDLFGRTINRRFSAAYHLGREDQPLHSSDFIYAPANHELYFTDAFNIVPIGAYGEEFSRDLLRTSQILTDLAVSQLKELSDEIAQKNSNITERIVDFGTRPGFENENKLTALRGLIAGIATMHQSITLLARDPVEGLETDLNVMKAIVFGNNGRGLITELARRAPMDFIGPSGISGIYTGDSLQMKNGSYSLGEGLIQALKNRRLSHISHMGRRTPREARALMGGKQGLGCPLGYTQASGKSPLQDLAELYYAVYLKVRAHRLSQQK